MRAPPILICDWSKHPCMKHGNGAADEELYMREDLSTVLPG
jgi:hypothetical protein